MDGEILPEPDPRQGTLNQGSPRIPQQGQPGSPSGPAAEKPQAQTPTLEIVPASMTRRVGRPRSAAVAGMVIHETQGSDTADGNFSWSNKKNTGANYYIDKSGKIIEWAPDNVVMNHAGKGRGVKGDVRPDLRNENTISVEIMTRPGEKPNQAQIEALHLLASAKATEHGFTVDDIRPMDGWRRAGRTLRKEPPRWPTCGTTGRAARACPPPWPNSKASLPDRSQTRADASCRARQ